jgi:hypothetical protein
MEDESSSPFTQPLEEPAASELHATLLVDAFNGFNELRRKAMLWTVKH